MIANDIPSLLISLIKESKYPPILEYSIGALANLCLVPSKIYLDLKRFIKMKQYKII